MATNLQRDISRHVLLALLALALIFLNFGHTSAVFAAGGRVVVTGTSTCGDQFPASAGDHFACHACRQVLVALPPPPCAIAPVVFALEAVGYADDFAGPQARALRFAPKPRGPPALA